MKTAIVAMTLATCIQPELDRAVTDYGLPSIVAEVDGQWSSAGEKRLPEHRFRIGSTTKTFVATVVLQLNAEGKLRLDDTIGRWVPGLSDRVTVRQLLNHTSGIFDYLQDPAIRTCANCTPERMIQIAKNHPAGKPGTWEYSNTNYIVAGMIVEQVTGNPLAEELATRITRPLNLQGTYLPVGDEAVIRGPHARHYTKSNNTTYDVTDMDPSPYWATGGMVSTTGDLSRFFQALVRGELLPPRQQREMFTAHPTNNWIPNTRYGLGISEVTLACGKKVWGMGGAIMGSWTYTYGDTRHVLAMNVNADWNNPIEPFTNVLHAKFCGTRPA
ncbi:serine hydrolase domain-containing protein [Kibdelosporangium aridum]|uniref:serine hydrolase domain-containing protein n=1 Tax=Kibdelosporangium aridum TaxID=2030 RepID=UPI00068D3EBB